MRYLLTAVCLFLYMGCSPKQVLNEPALGYSFMPKYMNLDSVGPALPKLPDSLANATALDYKSKPIFGGKYVEGKDTTYLPAGVLISEKSAVRFGFYESAYKRVSLELSYSKFLCKDYYDKSLSAEKLYQDEILRLRKEVKRTWLEKNIGYLGFGLGLTTAVLTEWAVLHVSK